MDITMPAGHVLRVPTAADAGAVAELLHARDVADLGEPEATVADVRAEWELPSVELERDAWVVEDECGALVAYALVTGPDLLIAVHPGAAGRAHGQHRGAHPPVGGGLVAGPPLLPRANRPQGCAPAAASPRAGVRRRARHRAGLEPRRGRIQRGRGPPAPDA